MLYKSIDLLELLNDSIDIKNNKIN
jgi:hypothetical protein